MNKKLSYISVFLILVMFLSGCAGGIPTAPGLSTDEAQIKSVIHEYFLAISNQNWNKARGYCVYGSDRYYATSQMESTVNSLYAYCNVVTINAWADITNVSVSGNYATAHFYLYMVATACGYSDSDSGYTNYNLQKVGNNWKIY